MGARRNSSGRKSRRAALWLSILFFGAAGPVAAEDLDLPNAARRCEQGVTVYCLALGMDEVRRGKRAEALEHYRLACVNHPTVGPLHACTPMLALARELNRLDEMAGPLETRCRGGAVLVCYYLAKEYLKIAETERAFAHLDPLCREGYRAPDPEDYGPCFHMGKALEARGEFARARSLYAIDCSKDRGPAQPGCRALQDLEKARIRAEQTAWENFGKFEPVETVLIFIVTVPLVSAAAWRFEKLRHGWWFRWAAPAAVLTGALVWWWVPKHYLYHPTDTLLIALSALTVGVLAWQARCPPAPGA